MEIGAEAVLERTAEGMRKQRLRKKYRHPLLDEALRKKRTKSEYRLLVKARSLGVPVPSVSQADDTTLVLEVIDGSLVRDVLDKRPQLGRAIGLALAKLHDGNIIHGDLTTSNMILRDTEIVLIDFGLGFVSQRLEDKAVDVHVFMQSLESKHYKVKKEAFAAFAKGYGHSMHAPSVLRRLKEVQHRGKNK